MTLSAGSRLGPYEIVSPLGAGGMGEVYRARDARLERDVALKLLPPEFSRDGDRLARFEREARVLASLNHPSIAAIYGIEESIGARFLVLELVPGEALAEKLTAEPLPLEEALGICRQIGEALEAAHERGVIHRDLKPGNVKITPAGKVKVLDFGLAKSISRSAISEEDVTETVTAAATQPGIVVGTAPYMSPEQVRGETLDSRTDIWAFGCVLYETLTRHRAMQGKLMTEILGAVLVA